MSSKVLRVKEIEPHLNDVGVLQKVQQQIFPVDSPIVMNPQDIEEIIAIVSTPTASHDIRSHGQSYESPLESILPKLFVLWKF